MAETDAAALRAIGKPCSECGEDVPKRFSQSSLRLGMCHHCEPVAPRWRDWHTLPDEWVINHLRPAFRRWHYPKWIARYALRHLHCGRDGQCVFRANHRGGCCWGREDDD